MAQASQRRASFVRCGDSDGPLSGGLRLGLGRLRVGRWNRKRRPRELPASTGPCAAALPVIGVCVLGQIPRNGARSCSGGRYRRAGGGRGRRGFREAAGHDRRPGASQLAAAARPQAGTDTQARRGWRSLARPRRNGNQTEAPVPPINGRPCNFCSPPVWEEHYHVTESRRSIGRNADSAALSGSEEA